MALRASSIASVFIQLAVSSFLHGPESVVRIHLRLKWSIGQGTGSREQEGGEEGDVCTEGIVALLSLALIL